MNSLTTILKLDQVKSVFKASVFVQISNSTLGTTKRRQYYYKKIANALLDCHPKVLMPSFFYKITMTLTCPLPEEQNTRGRKIYPPEESVQGFGILTSTEIPKVGNSLVTLLYNRIFLLCRSVLFQYSRGLARSA